MLLADVCICLCDMFAVDDALEHLCDSDDPFHLHEATVRVSALDAACTQRRITVPPP